MKKRRILVIHESGVFQSIIKRALTAEVPAVDLHEAHSAKEGLELLEDEPFDMVISANEMEYRNGTDIFEYMHEGGKHKHTGFLLLTSKLDKENRDFFKKKGIRALELPFKAGELAHEVESLSIPRVWREHRRYNIPDTTVEIYTDKESYKSNIVNVSLGGMLCDTRFADGLPKFSQYYQLKITFPKAYGNAKVEAVGYMLRQAALQWMDPPVLDIVQSAWRLTPLSDVDARNLEKIFDKSFQHAEELPG